MTQRLDDSIFAGHQDEAPPPRRGKGARRGLTIALAVLVVLLAGGFAVAQWTPLLRGIGAVSDYDGAGHDQVTVQIKTGDTGRDIAANLERAGVVRSAGAFEAALDRAPSPELQPGTYRLRQQMSGASALSLLRDPAARNVVKVTIREGLWKNEVFALLAKATGRPLAAYQAAAKDPGLLGLPATAGGNVEGYLFPSTYSFEPADTAEDHLRTMVGQTTKQLSDLGVPEEVRQRVLIVASIVEAEARLAPDRAKVARVIDNRLAANKMLQMDSTVSYGVQRRSITTTDAERAVKNGYGTYAHAGLPVGPIGNPGLASIKAALSPTPGKWMYFTTINPDTGETRFEDTDVEHAASVKLFQAWCAANKGRC